MATIETRKNKDGSISYSVNIRKKGFDISRTFYTEADAKLFEFYKERLIDNMNNFDVPIKDRTTLESIFEMKIESLENEKQRTLCDFNLVKNKVMEYFKDKLFYHQISFDEWKSFSDFLFNSDVFRGSKTENGKRKMSLSTLIRQFRVISSCVSYAISLGIPLENHPLKVIQTHLYQKDRQ